MTIIALLLYTSDLNCCQRYFRVISEFIADLTTEIISFGRPYIPLDLVSDLSNLTSIFPKFAQGLISKPDIFKNLMIKPWLRIGLYSDLLNWCNSVENLQKGTFKVHFVGKI